MLLLQQPLLLKSGFQQINSPLAAAVAALHSHSSPSALFIDSKASDTSDAQQGSRVTIGIHASRQTVPGSGNANRFASSSSEVTTTTGDVNSWTKFRAPYGFEQKSSLGPAMYSMIGVFGFSMYVNDLIYHPPRVVAMVSLMMLLLYVRRN